MSRRTAKSNERAGRASRRSTTAPRRLPLLGIGLSSEEHPPAALVQQAVDAEAAGFDFAMISDHYHPWIPCQGQSSFVWGVLGAIAARTRTLEVGTGVTCPIGRMHPAIVAQAAATAASLFGNRFWLGVGTGERLNEHVTGAPWPPVDARREMLGEAVGLIRDLWAGGLVDRRGRHYTVENARIYSLPDEPPPILVAAGGPDTAAAARAFGNGLIATSPDEDIVRAYLDGAGREAGPRIGQLTVCWAATDAEARQTAHRWWPNAALQGEVSQELAVPEHFEDLVRTVTQDQVAEAVVCGPDPGPYRRAIRAFSDAGFDHVYLHQVGPDQAGFLQFAERELIVAGVRDAA